MTHSEAEMALYQAARRADLKAKGLTPEQIEDVMAGSGLDPERFAGSLATGKGTWADHDHR